MTAKQEIETLKQSIHQYDSLYYIKKLPNRF